MKEEQEGKKANQDEIYREKCKNLHNLQKQNAKGADAIKDNHFLIRTAQEDINEYEKEIGICLVSGKE